MACLVLIVCALGACTDRPPDEVVVYCSADSYVATPIFEAFTEETGIEVRYLGDTEATKTVGLIEKLRAEKANPRADVFWSSDAYQLAAIAPVCSESSGVTITGRPISSGRSCCSTLAK